MKNLVSIIVPIYNSEVTIERCIKSIINQTYYNIEIILIDEDLGCENMFDWKKEKFINNIHSTIKKLK